MDTGDDFLRIASASRVVVDTHRTPWPALAVVGAGIAGGLAAGAIARRRGNTGRGSLLAVATLPAAGTVAVAVLLGFLLTPIGRPDPAAAALGGVLLTWWLAVPAGVVLALLACRPQASWTS